MNVNKMRKKLKIKRSHRNKWVYGCKAAVVPLLLKYNHEKTLSWDRPSLDQTLISSICAKKP